MQKHLGMNKEKKEILAKPSGITLDKHRNNVVSEGASIISSTPVVAQKYEQIVGKSLTKRLEIVCKHHDDGKEWNKKWQAACWKDYQAYCRWKQANSGTYSDYTQDVGEQAGKNIRLAATRHEFYSIKQFEPGTVPDYILVAIAAHHNKLAVKEEKRWVDEGFYTYWKYFNILRNSIKDNYKKQDHFRVTLRQQYELSGPRGLLQFADHRASAKEDLQKLPVIKRFEYKFPHKKKRGVQKIIEENWNNDLILVRAPTGAGKTDASLLWAQLQIQNKRAERLVIAMPTRFTSNALEINIAESLSNTGLYHSSAWSTKFQEKVESKQISRREAKTSHEFARLLYTPITVCTIDHLLMALTLTREDHHQITFNLANSCLVIDEADFYDDFTQANILTLLEALKEWHVPVLIMSASLPESVINSYKHLGYNINRILEDNTDIERYRFKIESITEYENITDIEPLLQMCIEKQAAIIYANTVDKALMFYNFFEQRKVKAILYHSRFTEPDKKRKEKELIDALGKDAWVKKQAKGIAILTQIGEMSINISADFMISEIAPIDRLTQRAGRLSRFKVNGKNNIGELHVVIPLKDSKLYPAPYGHFSLKEKSWFPIEPLIETINKLKKQKYNARTLVKLLNTIYASDSSFSANAKQNARHLKELFISNWLINSLSSVSVDDTDTNEWRSRDIPPQEIIYTSLPDNLYFDNYWSFQNWKLSSSLEIPKYLVEKYLTKNILDYKSIFLKGVEEKIIVVREGFYNYEEGIHLSQEENIW